ncbi:MAG: YdeI/OmpD-associated family protein [Pseudomonadales bacterium]|nr:YdeI/OmpD-associated family protein [Pseudomonadales bacterium]MCP5358396.1 YdeI/OmpD-associated family protein [Pseudomonadales bacterium]
MSKTDAFFAKPGRWQEAFLALRKILQEFPLTEEFKWGKPCYAWQGSNVVILQGFKEFCSPMFFKGALLKDPAQILEAPGENSRSAKRVRITSAQQVQDLAADLRRYIAEAIDIEKAGLKVELKENTALDYVEELQAKLESDRSFCAAFEALTPGRRRAYNLHFAGAKQAATRVSRIEKCVPRILEGLGLNDR